MIKAVGLMWTEAVERNELSGPGSNRTAALPTGQVVLGSSRIYRPSRLLNSHPALESFAA